ncbi:pilus assembly protein TadG-related protein [Streptomyces sp. HPF1205]|uniref:pilus assembly protein TadG-related protein n=1 Tax=Streptomyces sp. HPF1205 TaxID=2873262 RepID=UPI001CEC5B40|nr:pilus assembly protein TadG-related protein [Streptomyces sp. HPF1205]
MPRPSLVEGLHLRVFLARRFNARRFAEDRGQTVGIYIVAMAALFFLAFAYFAVGQATVTRNSAQTAADAAALAAARDYRDQMKGDFLKDLTGGDLQGLGQLLNLTGERQDPTAQTAAEEYADDNGATVTGFDNPSDSPPTFTVAVQTKGTVGPSVIGSTKDRRAVAKATAVVEPRCTLDDQGLGGSPTGGQQSGGQDSGGAQTESPQPGGGQTGGQTGGDKGGKGLGPIHLTCDSNPLTIDPTPADFAVNLSDFYSVHLITDDLPNQ